MNTWALTSGNKLRASTWGDAVAVSVSTEATGFPKENAVDGNIASEWRGSASPAWVILDSAEASPGYEYISLRFDYSKQPTSVKIETSDSVGSGYAEIANTYDGGVATTLSAAASRTSRTISVTSSTNIHAGNTILLNDGVKASKKYLVITVGVGYLVLDRYPEAYANGAAVTVYPDWHILAVVAPGESKRYVRITVTATTPHILEAQAFSVDYIFDGSALPLNPFPVVNSRSFGTIERSFSGYGIGRMHTGPNRSSWKLGVGAMGENARGILLWLERQERFGLLMDNGEWVECLLSGGADYARRLSSDANLLSYSTTLTVEEI